MDAHVLRGLLVAALGLTMFATPAPASAEAVATGPHCAVTDLETGELACYDTPDGAMNHGSPHAYQYKNLSIYDGFNYTTAAAAADLYFQHPCSSSYYLTIPRLDRYWPGTNYGINNRISSIQAHGSCRVKLYDFYDPKRPDNPSSAWINDSPNLGAWSNRASSLRLYIP